MTFQEFYRQNFPEDTRPIGDVLLDVGRSEQAARVFEAFPDAEKQYKDLERLFRPTLGQELTTGLKRSSSNLVATAYGAGAMAADLVGLDGARDGLAEKSQEWQDTAAQFPATVGSFRDVDNAGDALYYGTMAVSEVLPSMAETVLMAGAGALAGGKLAAVPGAVGGAVAGAVGRQGAKAMIRRAVSKYTKEQLARAGATVGVAASSVPHAMGEIYNETGNAPLSAWTGAIAGSLDMLPEAFLVGRFMRGGRAAATDKPGAIAYITRFMTEAAKVAPVTITTEGLTEAAQEFIEMAASKYNEGEPAFEVTQDDIDHMINAGLIGGIGGGMFVGPSAAMSARRRAETSQREDEPTPPDNSDLDPAQAAAPVAPPFIGLDPMSGLSEAVEPDADFDVVGMGQRMGRASSPLAGLYEAVDTGGVVTPLDDFVRRNQQFREAMNERRAQELQEALSLGQIGTQESVILGDDPIANRMTIMSTRPGESRREMARVAPRQAPAIDAPSVQLPQFMSPQAASAIEDTGFGPAPSRAMPAPPVQRGVARPRADVSAALATGTFVPPATQPIITNEQQRQALPEIQPEVLGQREEVLAGDFTPEAVRDAATARPGVRAQPAPAREEVTTAPPRQPEPTGLAARTSRSWTTGELGVNELESEWMRLSKEERGTQARYTVMVDGETLLVNTPAALRKLLSGIVSTRPVVFRNFGKGVTIDFDGRSDRALAMAQEARANRRAPATRTQEQAVAAPPAEPVIPASLPAATNTDLAAMLFRVPPDPDTRTLFHRAPLINEGLKSFFDPFRRLTRETKDSPAAAHMVAAIRDNQTGEVFLREMVTTGKGTRFRVENAGIRRQRKTDIDLREGSAPVQLDKLDAVTYIDETGQEAPRYSPVGVQEIGSSMSGLNINFNFEGQAQLEAVPGFEAMVGRGATTVPSPKGRRSGNTQGTIAVADVDAVRRGPQSVRLESALDIASLAEDAAIDPLNLAEGDGGLTVTPDSPLAVEGETGAETMGSVRQRIADIIQESREQTPPLSEVETKARVMEAMERLILTPEVQARINEQFAKTSGVKINKFVIEKMVDDLVDAYYSMRPMGTSYLLEPNRANTMLRDMVGAVRDTGGDVVLYDAGAKELVAGFNGLGLNGRSLVALGAHAVLNNSQGAVITMAHEAGHHFTRGLPEWMQLAFHHAIDQLPFTQQRWLNNPLSADLRLLANSPRDQLSPEQQALLDRLPAPEITKLRETPADTLVVEQAAEHLGMLGIAKGDAKNILDRIIRLMKSVMYQAGILLSRAMGVQPNPTLLRAYVENEFLRFISRDAAALSPAKNFARFIGAKPSYHERVLSYSIPGGRAQPVIEVDLATGAQIIPEFAPTTTEAMQDYIEGIVRNAELGREQMADLTVRLPVVSSVINDSAHLDVALQTNTAIAAANFTQGVYERAYQDSAVRLALPNITFQQFMTRWLGLTSRDSPKALRNEAITRFNDLRAEGEINPEIQINDLPKPEGALLGSTQATAIKHSIHQLQKTDERLGKIRAALKRQYDRLKAAEAEGRIGEEGAATLLALDRQIPGLNRIIEFLAAEQGRQIAKIEGTSIRKTVSKPGDGTPINELTITALAPGDVYMAPASPDQAPSAWKAHTVPKNFGRAKAEELRDMDSAIRNLALWSRNPDNAQYGPAVGDAKKLLKTLGELQVTEARKDERNFTLLRHAFRGIGKFAWGAGPTPLKQAASRLGRLESFYARFRPRGNMIGVKWQGERKRLKQALGMQGRDDKMFIRQVWNPLMSLLNAQPDGTMHTPNQVIEIMSSAYRIKFDTEAKRTALRNLREATSVADKFTAEIHEASGLPVLDTTLGINRTLLRQGKVTGMVKVSDALETTYNYMAGPTLQAIEEIRQQNPDSDMFAKYRNLSPKQLEAIYGEVGFQLMAGNREVQARVFDSEVISNFVLPYMRSPKTAWFVADSGRLRQAAYSDVLAAMIDTQTQMAGEGSQSLFVERFASKLHDKSRATGELNTTIESTLAVLGRGFDDVRRNATRSIDQAPAVNGINISRKMMDATTSRSLPPEFVEYSQYDEGALDLLAREIGLNAFLGRNGIDLDQLLRAAEADIKTAEDSMNRLKNIHGVEDPKAIEKAMGSEDYRMAVHAPALREMIEKDIPTGVSALAESTNSAYGDMRFTVMVVRFLAKMILQAPKSAVVTFFDMQRLLLRFGYGPTGIKSLGRASERFFRHALAATLGMKVYSEEAILRAEHGIFGEMANTSMRDRMNDVGTSAMLDTQSATETGYQKINRLGQLGLRRADAITDITVRDIKNFITGKADDSLQISKMRPLAIFSNFTEWMELAIGETYLAAFQDVATKTFEQINRNRQSMTPTQFENYLREAEAGVLPFTAEQLGYGRSYLFLNDKTFDVIRQDIAINMNGFGTFERFIVDAYRRTDGNAARRDLFTGEQHAAIQQIANTEVSLRANSMNMPVVALKNPYVRSLSTFLQWPYIATFNTLDTARDTKTQRMTWASTADFMTAIMLGALPVTMAGTLLIDYYDEKIVGKKSNLQQISKRAAVPGLGLYDAATNPEAVLERFVRYGPFGLIGDLVNSMVNYDDPRNGGISVDSRVFVISLLRNFTDTVNRVYNQDFQATYESAYRPMLQMAGLRGPLEYIQIVNNGLDLSNVEAQANERTNVGNYLRAYGRTLNMNVRKWSGAKSAPTAVTPWIHQMEIASINGDFSRFRDAYAKAVSKARETIPTIRTRKEAEKYALDALSQRHPLRKTFQTLPSDRDYRLILSTASPEGRQAISSAVNNYNTMLRRIGGKPFFGNTNAKSTASSISPLSITAARQSAAEAAYGLTPGF